MLLNRKFKVFLNDKASKYRYLQNGLLQGSVLSPMLFNIYISDITETIARKFMYADEIALVALPKWNNPLFALVESNKLSSISWKNVQLLNLREE